MRHESWSALTGVLAFFFGLGLISAGCGGGSGKSTGSGSSTLNPSPTTPGQPVSPVTTSGTPTTKRNPNPPNYPTPSPTPTTSPTSSPSPSSSPIPGPHLYSVNGSSNTITVFHYDTGTGALSLGADTAMPAAIKGNIFWAEMDSHTNTSLIFVSVLNTGAAGQVVPFQVNQGVLSAQTAATDVGQSPYGLAVEPTNKYVFSADTTGAAGTGVGVVSGFTYLSTGALTKATTPSTNAGNGLFSVVVDSAGTHLYAANYADNSVQVFSIGAGANLTTPTAGAGQAVTVTSIAPTTGPNIITISPGGTYIFAGNGDGSVTTISIVNGLLSSAAPKNTMASNLGASGAGVFGMAVDSATTFMVAVSGISGGGGDIALLTIAANGALTRVGAPITPGTGTKAEPSDVAIDPNNKFAFVTELQVEKIEVFNVSPTAITPIAGTSAFSYPSANDKGPTRVLLGN